MTGTLSLKFTELQCVNFGVGSFVYRIVNSDLSLVEARRGPERSDGS